MARKLRVQFPGALYHVVNRGNYRRDVFESAGAAQAFVTALEEATQTFEPTGSGRVLLYFNPMSRWGQAETC